MSEETHKQEITETSEEYTVIDPEQNPFPIKAQLFAALSFLLLAFGASFIPSLFAAPTDTVESTPMKKTQVSATQSGALTTTSAQPSLPELRSIEPGPLAAKAVYVWDLANQRALYTYNADKQLPLASVTKLMTALVAHEIIEKESTVKITSHAIAQTGDSGLLFGENFTLQNLLDLTLITSSNDGAYALADAAGNELMSSNDPVTVFVEAMNIRAEELGLSKTYFRNPTGLDESQTEAGAYGSARDMAFMMEYIISVYPHILKGTTESLTKITNTSGAYHLAENTNSAIKSLPGLIASKTGYTELAGGNLVTAINIGLNHPIIIVVLGSSHEGRFSDTLTLHKAIIDEIAENQ